MLACIFVFSSGDPEFIHLETFKIASIMAVRCKVVNLAVPVLARIYHGLNKIATFTYAGSSDACFSVHYVYGWLSHYFDTYFPMSKKVVRPWMVDFFGEGGAKPFNENFVRKLIHTNISWDAIYFPRTGIYSLMIVQLLMDLLIIILSAPALAICQSAATMA